MLMEMHIKEGFSTIRHTDTELTIILTELVMKGSGLKIFSREKEKKFGLMEPTMRVNM
jgi:hypothetical protein